MTRVISLKTILLSIKPEYVEQILAGKKKYEYRKRLPKTESSTLFIYCTAPVMKIVAKVEIVDSISAAPSTLWEQTKKHAGISRKKYREYFNKCKTAYAYKLGNVEIFDPPKSLSEFNITTAPQSYMYIDI